MAIEVMVKVHNVTILAIIRKNISQRDCLERGLLSLRLAKDFSNSLPKSPQPFCPLFLIISGFMHLFFSRYLRYVRNEGGGLDC